MAGVPAVAASLAIVAVVEVGAVEALAVREAVVEAAAVDSTVIDGPDPGESGASGRGSVKAGDWVKPPYRTGADR